MRRVRTGGDYVGKKRRQSKVRPITTAEDSPAEAHPGNAGRNEKQNNRDSNFPVQV